jgi:dolichol-phosphate mannosyltransferase
MIVAVVIPAYNVREHVLGVIAGIGAECQRIFVVDDACPTQSGKLVEEQCRDPRVRVLFHASNQGVGGATVTGYRAALEDGADVIVKLDGDGQMNPALIPKLVAPIVAGQADYVKGNRFYHLEDLRSMPSLRLAGNACLSFLSKLSSGYWNIFDPTNGLTAIHSRVVRAISLHKLDRRWFFESDVLFRLGLTRAVVQDLPMTAIYKDEVSSLRIYRVTLPFLAKHILNTLKRLFYMYYLRDFSVASIELFLGPLLTGFGLWTGVRSWVDASRVGEFASPGTVMLAALPILSGLQFLLAFLGYDVRNIPTSPIHHKL